MAFDLSRFLTRFVEEAKEHCSRLSEGLLTLESSAGDAETLNALFRSAHTIKGSSRMMKLAGITELAHRMEDVLDAVRSEKIPITAPTTDMLFGGVDALTAMLACMDAGESSPEAPGELCDALARLAAGKGEGDHQLAAGAAEPGPAEGAGAAETAAPVPETPAPSPGAAGKAAREYLRIDAVKLDELIRLMGDIVSEHRKFRKNVARLRELERCAAEHSVRLAAVLGNSGDDHQDLVEAGAALQLSLRQTARDMTDASLMQDHLVADLQETSLKMRMQPLSTVFDPLRRTIRDLAREHGREVAFVVEGAETELDRQIIDRIGDSLLHMIRNALDHGLESRQERAAASKPAGGTIRLSACYDSGCVTIALSDDGRGMSPDRIGRKALEKGLVDAGTLGGMSRAEITNLIFTPGFSTSAIITDLSGRGVGMDVVHKNIVDELKGTIFIDTNEGSGTTFFLRLPLNLAVFPLFLVLAGEEICALQATSIVEMLTVEGTEIIEIVNKRAIRLRNQIIPVENLAALLKLSCAEAPPAAERTLVIVRDGEEKLALIVDDILGREEMVVKPLPAHLQSQRFVSGVTIGDRNNIVNVLHAPELLRLAREISQPGQSPPRQKKALSNILVVDDSLNTREIEKSILEAHGYAVATAEDGEEAYVRTRNLLYDLVITDVEMPRLDGFSLTERLRADERYRYVPIIIVTSRQKEEDKRRGITVGASAYIVKGAFDQSNLLETVRALIG